MKAKFIIYIFVLSTFSCFAKDVVTMKEQNATNDSLNNTIEKLNSKLNAAFNSVNYEVKTLKERYTEQAAFYKASQEYTCWVFTIIVLVLGAAFTVFIWLFKQPDEIIKKMRRNAKCQVELLEKELETKVQKAQDIISNLEKQSIAQKSLFVVQKGMNLFTIEDWAVIHEYAMHANLISDEKKDTNDWLFIGLSTCKKGDYDKSIAALKESIALEHDSEIAYKSLGNTYVYKLDYNNAITSYNEVLRINKKNDKAYNNLGLVYTRMNNIYKAKQNYYEAIKINPKDASTYTNLFETNLIFNEPFEKYYLKIFMNEFKNDISHFSVYKMLLTLRLIADGDKKVDELLAKWLKLYGHIGCNQDLDSMYGWISKFPDGEIKTNLNIAINFFKDHT
jgi:tetratricopeptide (TPR) repeat protein